MMAEKNSTQVYDESKLVQWQWEKNIGTGTDYTNFIWCPHSNSHLFSYLRPKMTRTQFFFTWILILVAFQQHHAVSSDVQVRSGKSQPPPWGLGRGALSQFPQIFLCSRMQVSHLSLPRHLLNLYYSWFQDQPCRVQFKNKWIFSNNFGKHFSIVLLGW